MKPDLQIHANDIDFACLERGSGPLALVLHGFPDTPVSFIPLLDALAEAGYRAVAPWMRGYAPTSIPKEPAYANPTLVADANALHDALGGGPDAVIIGHDWGATVAYAAGSKTGRWAKQVVMSVPPPPHFIRALMTFDQLKRSFYMWLFQLGFAEKAVSSHDFALLEGLWRDWSPGYDPTSALVEVRRSIGLPENLTAALGYYRDTFASFRLGGERSAAPVPPQPSRIPGLYLHGANDGCIGIDETMRRAILTAFPEGSAAEIVPDAGHFLISEKPEEMSARIIEFLRG